MKLTKYGLDNFFLSQINPEDIPNLGKVVSVHKNGCKIETEEGSFIGVIKGSEIHYKSDTESLPKVGDFVLIETLTDNTNEEKHFISKVLERKNTLQRKIAGDRKFSQVIATNIDYAFITISLDEQFNINKCERMVLSCLDSDIKPTIVLTKSDLLNNNIEELSNIKQTLQQRFENIEIIHTTHDDEGGVKPIVDLLSKNKTGIFIGSSGAGKSTLTNIILGSYVQKVSEVSSLESKGRHTTTHRELFTLSTGGSIIDTPGIKEFGIVLEDEESIDKSFSNIAEIASRCKFRNCSHSKEIGCAIQEALLDNTITKEQFENYLKLINENTENNLTRNKMSVKDKRKKEKEFAKVVKNVKRHKSFISEIDDY